MPARKHKESKPEPDSAVAEAPREAGQTKEPESEAAGQAEADRVVRLEADVVSLKDQLLRALAETENLRRRSQREREEVAKYAAAPLIRDLVGVVDNLRRAMDSVPSEAVAGDEQLEMLLAGLAMTEKELAAVFEKHHIVKIEPLGERLDPHYHEAIFEIPNPAATSGTVLQVLQAGYRLHDRLLRPAQVGVAKGGSAPAPAPETATEDSATDGPEPSGGDGETPPGSTIDTTA